MADDHDPRLGKYSLDKHVHTMDGHLLKDCRTLYRVEPNLDIIGIRQKPPVLEVFHVERILNPMEFRDQDDVTRDVRRLFKMPLAAIDYAMSYAGERAMKAAAEMQLIHLLRVEVQAALDAGEFD